jgi:hypothetical protein
MPRRGGLQSCDPQEGPMEDRSRLLEQFERAFNEADEVGMLALLDLSDDEVSELAGGLASLSEPIQAACRIVLDDWQCLGARARVAALLVLANALAEGSEQISPS